MEKCERKKILYRASLKIIFFILLIPINFAFVDSSMGTNLVIPKSLSSYVNVIMLLVLGGIFVYDNLDLIKNRQRHKHKFLMPHRYKLLKITKFMFSTKTQKETFEQIMADWDLEVYEAFENKENNRLLMINLRNTYWFFLAMWQKSPIGDLIEFISKIAK